MKQEHVLSCQVARYLRMRGYITADCDVMSALKYLPLKDDRNRAMFVKSRKEMGYTLGQADLIVINKYGKAGKQSDNQKYFEQEIKCRGGNYVLIRTLDDVVDFVNRDLKAGAKCSNNGEGTKLQTFDLSAFLEQRK